MKKQHYTIFFLILGILGILTASFFIISPKEDTINNSEIISKTPEAIQYKGFERSTCSPWECDEVKLFNSIYLSKNPEECSKVPAEKIQMCKNHVFYLNAIDQKDIRLCKKIEDIDQQEWCVEYIKKNG